MTIATRREAQERQRAEKRTQFGNGPPLQKHQGSGRRRKRLCSNGHDVSSRAGPLRLGSQATGSVRRTRNRIVRNATWFHKKAREPVLVLQAAQVTLEISKGVDVIN